jgi:hypothetical protein
MVRVWRQGMHTKLGWKFLGKHTLEKLKRRWGNVKMKMCVEKKRHSIVFSGRL